jgi:hypothetical protein
MKRLGFFLCAAAIAAVSVTAMTAHTAFSDDNEIAGLKKDIQKILLGQAEILKEIAALREDINIVKIRSTQ